MAAEPFIAIDPRLLVAAGWRLCELEWETLQERAAEAAQKGDLAAASTLWARALFLARKELAEPDLRLATSLANQAHALAAAGRGAAADDLHRQALLRWDSGALWVDALKPDRRARSSTFHLRLQAKDPKVWSAQWRKRIEVYLEIGRKALREPDAPGAARRLDQWRREKPQGLSDLRRVMAAALLIA